MSERASKRHCAPGLREAFAGRSSPRDTTALSADSQAHGTNRLQRLLDSRRSTALHAFTFMGAAIALLLSWAALQPSLGQAIPVLAVLGTASAVGSVCATDQGSEASKDPKEGMAPRPFRYIMVMACSGVWACVAANVRGTFQPVQSGSSHFSAATAARVIVSVLVATTLSMYTASLWMPLVPRWMAARLSLVCNGIFIIAGTSTLYVITEGEASSYPPGKCSLPVSLSIGLTFVFVGLSATTRTRALLRSLFEALPLSALRTGELEQVVHAHHRASEDASKLHARRPSGSVVCSLPPGPPSSVGSDEPDHALPPASPRLPNPVAATLATEQDGACCARGLKARGMQILREASSTSHVMENRGTALFAELTLEQRDRLLMPPPPPRTCESKAHKGIAKGTPVASASKRQRSVEQCQDACSSSAPYPPPPAGDGSTAHEQSNDALGLVFATVAPMAATCGTHGPTPEDAAAAAGADDAGGDHERRAESSAAVEGMGAMVVRASVDAPPESSSESSSLLTGDVIVALGGLPVKTAACVEGITAAWPKNKTLCAKVVRNRELVSISLMLGRGTAPRLPRQAIVSREPSETELDLACTHMVAQLRLADERRAVLEDGVPDLNDNKETHVD